jgi:hypothetical protein
MIFIICRLVTCQKIWLKPVLILTSGAMLKRFLPSFLFCFALVNCFAQKKSNSTEATDLLDLMGNVFHHQTKPKVNQKKIAFSIIPTTTQSGGKQILVSSINAYGGKMPIPIFQQSIFCLIPIFRKTKDLD